MSRDVEDFGEHESGIKIIDDSFQEKVLSKEAFEDIIKILKPADQNMLRLHIEDGLNFCEIGKIVGLSGCRVCQIFNDRIFPKIQNEVVAI